MSINEQELQNKVEKVVDNYMKRAKSFHRQRSSISMNEEQRDLTQEIAEKEFQKNTLLEELLKQISLIIDNLIQRHLFDFQNQLLHLQNELYQLKTKQFHIGSQESTIKQTLVLSKNSSFTDFNEQFLSEDQIKNLKNKIKNLKEDVNKKTQYHDSLINMLLDQQKDLKENLRKNQYDLDVKSIEKRMLDQIWLSVETQSRDFVETKFHQLKQLVESNNQKQKEKDAVMWTIVNECKCEMDKMNLKLNSVNNILHEIKENNNWFPRIWKAK
ncbi:unnamed protein product [Paramecium pentaurelia]|uniref:Uncharacterized protein n=1 Tax=Paramecium pentaurelia TaxID=43138 RepID=A0A8S1U6C2_9CILI|nr:unnamed protein product [Paramecium pentaurelia]